MLSTIFILIVALEHFYIMYLEMCCIPSAKASRIFRLDADVMQHKTVQTLFSNQGLYNGFLAFGLIWARFFAPDDARFSACLLFLSFVICAAIWGAITSTKSILWKQGLPAFIAIYRHFGIGFRLKERC